jgi:hypothetical protein
VKGSDTISNTGYCIEEQTGQRNEEQKNREMKKKA